MTSLHTSSFSPEYNALGRIWVEALKPLATHRPNILYHYTTASGLTGIMNSGKLFFSDALFLNDHVEVLYGKDVVAAVLNSRATATSDENIREVLLKTARLMLMPQMTRYVYRFFIASFCRDGDRLGQWRAYGMPGTGYAIGFKSKHLRNTTVALDVNLSVQLWRIEYRSDRQVALVNAVIDAALSEFIPRAVPNANPERYVVIHLAMAISLLLPLLKHPVFAEEREWRAVVTTIGDQPRPFLSFRHGREMIVPHLTIDLRRKIKGRDLLPIATITHAPGPEPELTKRVLEDLLETNKYPPGTVRIRGSEIPLRLS